MIQIQPISASQLFMNTLMAVPEFRALMENYNSIELNLGQYMPTKKAAQTLIATVRSHTGSLVYFTPIPVSKLLRGIWIATHVVTILGTLLYLYSDNKSSFTFWYHVASSSAVLTYLLVVYRHTALLFRQNMRPHVSGGNSTPLFMILKSENTHLMFISILVATSEECPIKLLSFCVYSVMNLGDHYVRGVFSGTEFSVAVLPLLSSLEFPLLSIAAYAELILFFLFLRSAFISGKFSKLVMYCAVFGLRVETSEYCFVACSNCINICRYVLNRSRSLLFAKRSDRSESIEEEGYSPLEDKDLDSEQDTATATNPNTGTTLRLDNHDIGKDFQYMYNYIKY